MSAVEWLDIEINECLVLVHSPLSCLEVLSSRAGSNKEQMVNIEMILIKRLIEKGWDLGMLDF